MKFTLSSCTNDSAVLLAVNVMALLPVDILVPLKELCYAAGTVLLHHQQCLHSTITVQAYCKQNFVHYYTCMLD